VSVEILLLIIFEPGSSLFSPLRGFAFFFHFSNGVSSLETHSKRTYLAFPQFSLTFGAKFLLLHEGTSTAVPLHFPHNLLC